MWSESTDELKQGKDLELEIVSYGAENHVTTTSVSAVDNSLEQCVASKRHNLPDVYITCKFHKRMRESRRFWAMEKSNV